MYLQMILWLLTWPILIYVTYLVAKFAIKNLKD